MFLLNRFYILLCFSVRLVIVNALFEILLINPLGKIEIASGHVRYYKIIIIIIISVMWLCVAFKCMRIIMSIDTWADSIRNCNGWTKNKEFSFLFGDFLIMNIKNYVCGRNTTFKQSKIHFFFLTHSHSSIISENCAKSRIYKFTLLSQV